MLIPRHTYDVTVDRTSQQGNQQLHCLLNDNGSPVKKKS